MENWKTTWRIVIVAAVLTVTFSANVAQAADAPFSDVEEGEPYFLAVSVLKEKGILDGFEDGSFEPDEQVSRAEALNTIMRIKKLRDPEPTIAGATLIKSESAPKKKPFRDVKLSHPYVQVIREAKKEGIVKGLKKGKYRYFRPNESVNLAEVLRMTFKAHGIDTAATEINPEAGGTRAEWYANDVKYALKKTMLLEQQNGAVFPPHEKLTRGQLAILLYRFLETQSNISFGYGSWYGDGLAHTKIPSGHDYKERNLTAAHKELPFGTIVRVTSVSTGKSVDVVVNDRGPYVKGRIIDLSKTAFSQLVSPGAGVIQVQIEPISFP